MGNLGCIAVSRRHFALCMVNMCASYSLVTIATQSAHCLPCEQLSTTVQSEGR